MSDSFRKLLKLFEQELPGEAAHLAMLPMRAATSEALKSAENVRLSAVAIVLFDTAEGLQTLVIQRQQYEGTHSGQISFPGGKWEQSDTALEFTARREYEEEIGISGDELQLIGKLTNVFIPVSSFLIEPYVFYWPDPHMQFHPSVREVAAIHTLPISLLTDESIELIDIQIHGRQELLKIPHFGVGDLKIWGATALILNELRKVLNDF